MPQTDPLDGFVPAVARWFRAEFAAPSPPQVMAWPAIRRGDNTLVLAPTGSGKTLATFLCAIDSLFRAAAAGELPDRVQVIYISPLKALGNDIHRNLVAPLENISKRSRGKLPEIRIAVRTGDTPQRERARMIRTPPHILITTPESLFLLLGSDRMRDRLGHVRTVIVDEVHALCSDKRGVHLAVSLERLQAQCAKPFQRIGCSATIKPLDEIAAFLVGVGEDGRQRPCTIVDAGTRKDLDVRVMAPVADFLEATNASLWASAYELLVREIQAHETTLIFCNSRYKAERTALKLAELGGDGIRVGVHHGSMARERRLEAEQDLKTGKLDALVATTALELGIDIGSIDLVYQLESPRNIATGLQRIGRAGHLLGATSKGRVLVFERDELIEAAAICRAMTEGEIDSVELPANCLDVLAQQIVGAVAAGAWDTDALYGLCRAAWPYRDLSREDFDTVLLMLAGDLPFEMAMPPLPLVLWERVTNRLVAARGAKSAALMNVGTIGESSEYDVLIDGTKKRVGKIQAEFVDDSLRNGDVFVLGSTSWRVQGKRRNQLLVKEAPGSTPTVPWWMGPVPSRSVETGVRVGLLRRDVAGRLDAPDLHQVLMDDYCLSSDAATAIADYLREQRAAGTLIPDHQQMLVEVWRDELGRMNTIVFCPLSQRINRTWSLALALLAQARFGHAWTSAASNDLILLTDPEPGTAVSRDDIAALLQSLNPDNLPALLETAARGAVSSGTAFRDIASTALQTRRMQRGQRVPLWLQNHRAEELFEAVKTVAHHPVLTELQRSYAEQSLDRDGLSKLLHEMQDGVVDLTVQAVESPSPFAHAFLVQDFYRSDHQMGRERRANLLRLHRQVLEQVLTSEQMADLLDARAIDQLQLRLQHESELSRARNADELAAALHNLGDVPATLDTVRRISAGDPGKQLRSLIRDKRVVAVRLPGVEDGERLVATDLWVEYRDAFGGGRSGRFRVWKPRLRRESLTLEEARIGDLIPARLRRRTQRDTARDRIVSRYLKCRGPVTAYEIANHTGWPLRTVETLLDGLVAAGVAAKGVYHADKPRPQYVNKANLEEIHRLTMRYLKTELGACAPYEVVDFMTRWQHVHPDTRLQGIDGLRRVIRQLQGYETVTAALESEVLAGRVSDYTSAMLDELMASGEVAWRRVGERLSRGRVTLCFRADASWLASRALQFDPEQMADEDIRDHILRVRDYLRQRETTFFDPMVAALGLDESVAMRAIWCLAWLGEVSCDTYECLRYSDFTVTMSACYDLGSTPRKIVNGKMSADRVIKQMNRRKLDPRLGRWWATERLLNTEAIPEDQRLRHWVNQLLDRWGIVSRDMLAAECAAPAWAALLPELTRRELMGELRRGFFIESHQGEQFGLPEAIELLRDCRARRAGRQELGYQPDEPVFCLSNRDPANLYASNLDIIDERGEVFPRPARQGNFIHHTVIQAGQSLVDSDIQLVTLGRDALLRCLQCQLRDAGGRQRQVRIINWNNYPVDVSPAAPVLWEAGLRFNSRRELVYPPPRKSAFPEPEDQGRTEYLPYCTEPAPVEYGLAWTVSRAREPLRQPVEQMLTVLSEELGRRDWHAGWRSDGLAASYPGNASLLVQQAKTFAQLLIQSPPGLIDGKPCHLRMWQAHPGMRVTNLADVDDFARSLPALLDVAEECARQREERTKRK